MLEYSIPALAEIPARCNAADVVARRAAEQPHAVMLRRKAADGTWSDVTAAQFADEVHALAKGFIAAGVEVGDRIALMSHTRYEWTLIDYALWTAGAIVVPIYETSSPEQAEWILGNSAARAVIAETDGFASMISDGIAEGSVRPVDPSVAAQMLDAMVNACAELSVWVPGVSQKAAPAIFARPFLMGVFSR